MFPDKTLSITLGLKWWIHESSTIITQFKNESRISLKRLKRFLEDFQTIPFVYVYQLV